METVHRTIRSSRFYEKLIRLYPPSYLKAHKDELLQNFEDLRHDIGSPTILWAFIISDFIKSLLQEYMEYIKNHRSIQFALAALLVIALWGTSQVLYLQKAHSTFDNYAAFRGCTHITDKTDTEGTCTTDSGESVTIVQFNNRWYLKGDLPVCMITIGSFCLIDQP